MAGNICPLCGEENGCMSWKTEACWCTHEEFPSGIFELIPNELLHKVCICRKCLLKFKEEMAAGR
ncbi:cysteine-rich CWC family protein [Neobacillus sp. SCS-31]|uniref:cysteine-rich CWC family protein n=1 Tax=Neobacillus oceani TaxID=3115292 RepID=UPI003906B119